MQLLNLSDFIQNVTKDLLPKESLAIIKRKDGPSSMGIVNGLVTVPMEIKTITKQKNNAEIIVNQVKSVFWIFCIHTLFLHYL